MSNTPSSKPQSERELKTARTLNTVATIGAGHAIYASVPKKWKESTPGFKKLVESGWVNPPQDHKVPLPPKVRSLVDKAPKLKGAAKVTAAAGAGTWLGLHGAELAGDVMARRSINNQLQQKSGNKGRVNSVEKNAQSMISKADGAVSRNGHGKNLNDNVSRGSVAAGTAYGAFVGGIGGTLVKKPKSKLKNNPGRENLPRGMKSSGSPVLDNLLEQTMHPDEREAHIRNKHAYNKMNHEFKGIVEQNNLKPSRLVRAKLAGHKLGANRYRVAGSALGGAAIGGMEYLNQKDKSRVNKASEKTQRNVAMVAGAVPQFGGYTGPIYSATQAKKGNRASVAGRTFGSQVAYGLGGTVLGASGVIAHHKHKYGERGVERAMGTLMVNPKAKLGVVLAGGAGSAYGARRAMTNAQKRGDIKKVGGRQGSLSRGANRKPTVSKPTDAQYREFQKHPEWHKYAEMHHVSAEEAMKELGIYKAYRRFDPEADRQRRLGLYAGTGVGTSIVAGREAARHFETKAVSGAGAKTVTHRGIVAKPGQGKKGLALAALAAASGAAGAGSYKRGLSVRNQPWT